MRIRVDESSFQHVEEHCRRSSDLVLVDFSGVTMLFRVVYCVFRVIRFESSDKDGEDGGHGDGYNSEFSYGSDLYKDEEDRQNLAAMTELQREMELAERSEKRDTWLALRKSRGGRQAESSRPRDRRDRDVGPPSSRMRSSVREVTRSKKENALSELVARRQRAQDPGLQRRRRDAGLKRRDREAASPGMQKTHGSPSFRCASDRELS